jgi:hypothetical protein
MGDASTLHLEPLQRPVSGRYRSRKARSKVVALELHGIERVELIRARLLFQNFVDRSLEVGVVRFEEIFKE